MNIYSKALYNNLWETFARLLDGAVHNLNLTNRIHRCPENRMIEASPQHQALYALLFTNSVWVL